MIPAIRYFLKNKQQYWSRKHCKLWLFKLLTLDIELEEAKSEADEPEADLDDADDLGSVLHIVAAAAGLQSEAHDLVLNCERCLRSSTFDKITKYSLKLINCLFVTTCQLISK